MEVKIVEGNTERIAIISSNEVIINDGQSALDFFANIGYEHDCRNISMDKAAVCEGFFDLRTGIAGEVSQKFVNYGFRLAIVGDFSGYTSKALNDYIYECNKCGPLYFVNDESEALKKLGGRLP